MLIGEPQSIIQLAECRAFFSVKYVVFHDCKFLIDVIFRKKTLNANATTSRNWINKQKSFFN